MFWKIFCGEGVSLTKKYGFPYTNSKSIEHIILDTPAVAHISHRFYEKAGFKRINSEELPV